MLKVTIYDNPLDEDPLELNDVDYVSYVSPDTYGPPALVAPNKGQPPTASVGERVVYINTGPGGPPMWEIERTADH